MIRILLESEIFGRLAVLRRVKSSKSGSRSYECLCSCGNKIVVTGSSLLRNDGKATRSCGCARREYLADRNKQIKYLGRENGQFKHGGTVQHPVEYKAYKNARNRCFNPNNPRFSDYGGRGIKFLFTSFQQFFIELGSKPKGLSLDRIDNNGNYEPGNVRWATKQVQRNNQRRRDGKF